MKTFKLTAYVTVSIYTDVEANSLEEALDIAERRSIKYTNNDRFDDQEKEVWVCDDFDGMAVDIQEDE